MKNFSISTESILFSILLGTSFVLASTGLICFLIDRGIFLHISSLLHAAIGLVLTVALFPYMVLHFKRIYGVRRFSTFISGLVANIVMLMMILSGLSIAYTGHTQTNDWLIQLHIYSGLFYCMLFALHLLVHGLTYSKHRKSSMGRFPTTTKSVMYVVASHTVIIVAGILIWISHFALERPYSDHAAVADYQYPYGDHPFRPSQTETLHSAFIDERALDTTAKCAQCHADIVAQWNASAHRQAASDRSYVTNINLLVKNKGIEAARYCEGCHAPIALLTGQLSEGGIHGGIEGYLANTEGVNCQSCHGIQDLVHTNGVASYHFGINQAYLFETNTSPILASLNRLSIKYNPKQHKEDMLANVQSSSKVCASCHAQFMDKDMNDWGWVKMQDEFSAWLDSPYSGTSDPEFAHMTRQRCQDCHMPMVSSEDPAADKSGQVRDHRFIGANTMLPTLNNDYIMLAATEKFLRGNKVRISIEPPHRQDATVNKIPVQAEANQSVLQPYFLYKGEMASINVVVANVGVGHDFPAGTIDINQAWVAFQVFDADGEIIYVSGDVDEEGYLDEQAYQYRSIPVDRQGNHVWKHDLFNMVGTTSINVVKAGQSDVVNYQFKVPYWIKGPISISAQVKYRKLNTQYAKWALQGDYQPLPITDMARAQLTVPIRQSKKAVDKLLSSTNIED